MRSSYGAAGLKRGGGAGQAARANELATEDSGPLSVTDEGWVTWM
jgi:hypothetical protein